MDCRLIRKDKREDGIFGTLQDMKGADLFCTLEHAFSDGQGGFIPKLAAGTYQCKTGTGPGTGEFQGMHRLHDGVWFGAYEVQNVPEFEGKPVTGILFHIGNYNQDSDGCCLLGKQLGWKVDHKGWMIMASGVAFKEFMVMQKGEPFTLVVE